MCFIASEKAEWQKEKEKFTETKIKLEEEKQIDAIKIQEFNVSQTNKCLKQMALENDLGSNIWYLHLPISLIRSW